MAAVAVAFAAGIALAEYLPAAGWLLLIGAVLLAAVVLLPMQRRMGIIILALVAVGGAIRYTADRSIAPDDISRFCRQVSAFEGTAASDTTGDPGAGRLTFRVHRIRVDDRWRRASGDVMLSMYSEDGDSLPRLDYGDRARITVRPYIPSDPTNPGQFSWKDYLARHGIYACASVRHAEDVHVLRRSRGRSIVGVALATKHYLVWAINRVHPPHEASVMSGMVLGTYAYLDDQTLQDFTRTGTLHLLAASGYNCFALVMIATPILCMLRVQPRRRGPILVVLIVAYLLIIGPVPSLVRAAVMASLLLLAPSLGRVPDYANLFYVAGLALLIANPSNLFDVGFQLSFAAVWALIAVAPLLQNILKDTHLYDRPRRKRKSIGGLEIKAQAFSDWMWRTFTATLVGTIAVTLVTGPLVAHYFHYVSLSALPANLAAEFLVNVVFGDSFLSAITAHIPVLHHVWGILGTIATRAMLSVIGSLSALRYSSVAVQSPGILGIGGYYVVLWAAAGYVRSRFAQR